MTEIQFLMIPHAPKPIAPYSHVVEVDGWAFITGQLVRRGLPERLCFRAWSAIRRPRA
jgi:enamine deaminase RidA (YjgF/YER057c/UK114 family)